jgi:hypothetical protein
MTLLTKLLQADVVCRDCGEKYGKYSVGCSSVWEGTCDVCDQKKPVTEVRDWGYLGKGIQELKGNIKEQSKKVASYMETVGPIMTDEELDEALEENKPSYEQGEITLKLTEDEVAFLNECLDVIVDNHESLCPGHSAENPEDIKLFEGIEKKITELYDDHCVKYGLSPALQAYYEKYGEYGTGEYAMRWEGFRDAFVALNTESTK